MIRSPLLVCASFATIDERLRNLSVFNILTQLSFASFPMLFPEFVSATILSRDTTDPPTFQGNLVVDFDGREVGRWPLPVDFQATSQAILVLFIQNLVIPGPGTLTLHTQDAAGTSLADWTISVSAQTAATSLPVITTTAPLTT
jgi:hypothetical protein